MFWLMLFSPLIGALINGLILRNASKVVSQVTGTLAVLASFICGLVLFGQQDFSANAPKIILGMPWFSADYFRVSFDFILDQLSLMMVLIITGIGTLIHIYAGGYLHEEPKLNRFYTYLNLFVFMMLMLVLGENLIVMFVGWEGVGLCSYLLIGYWYSEDKNAQAGMKAFVVNRIGDIGFLLGTFLIVKHFGTVSFTALRELLMTSVEPAALAALPVIAIFLFLGATGKSAQLPLYVWLPDAMAGPTPVSALIHAATMVTAGVYMMCRLNFLFFLAPQTMHIIAYTGAITAFVAATIALVQSDIKKVLAYSTVSQLGYMVLAVGVGGFDAAAFHLLTHACFKALLFLGAGSVIVAMHHEQDMFKMGGLRKKMPFTYICFLIAVLAIIGFPGLAGFFSKDEILWKAYLGGGVPLWSIAAFTAVLTSFYMVRLFCLTFLGECRADKHTQEHLHETPVHMWAPLVILALLSAVVGYLGVPPILGGSNHFGEYLKPLLQIPDHAVPFWNFLHGEHDHHTELLLMGISVGGMLVSSAFAVTLYAKGPSTRSELLFKRFRPLHNLLFNKYWIDEIYAAAIVIPLKEMSYFLWKVVDVLIVDGLVNGISQFASFSAGFASMRMSGSIHRHGMTLVIGVICLLTVLIV